jgi:immune inhibitor A
MRYFSSMRKFLLLALFFSLSAGLLTDTFAVPARPGVITLKQKDGSIIKARIHGDEFCHWVTTAEGYNIIGGGDGNWYFAELDKSGSLVSTGIKVVPTSRLNSSERSLLIKDQRPQMTARQTVMKAQMAATTLSVPESSECPPFLTGSTMKATGHPKALVILVAFTDVPFQQTSTREAFDEMMNGRNYTVNGSTGSAWQYYYENSNGKFDPDFTIAGPYTLAHERAYYTADGDARAPEMAMEAAKLADADIDFTQYAADGRGYDIFVYYSGGQEADGSDKDGIWPHRGYFNSIELDGVQLSGYACSSELCYQEGYTSIGFTQIGSFCHEYGHTLGLPDFYNTNGNSDPIGPTNYSLMDVGCYNNTSRTPPALNILERWMLGWAEPEVVESDGDYVIRPVTSDAGYMVRTAKTGEYFLLECRGAGQNVWDDPRYLDFYGLGTYWGLIAYHVDVSKTSLWRSNQVNIASGSECFHLVFSDPSSRYYYDPVYIPGHCFFPGENRVTEIVNGTTVGYEARDGSKPTGNIVDIQLNDSDHTVSFTYSSRSSAVKNVRSEAWQHDAIVTWTDAEATSWTVTCVPVSGGEARSVTVTECAAHLSLLKADTEYEVTIVNDRKGQSRLSVATLAEGRGNPRITLSASALSSSEPVLFTLSDCGDYSDVKWTVDGANSDNYRTLSSGERRIQATVTLPDGSKEYYLRYVNVIL